MRFSLLNFILFIALIAIVSGWLAERRKMIAEAQGVQESFRLNTCAVKNSCVEKIHFEIHSIWTDFREVITCFLTQAYENEGVVDEYYGRVGYTVETTRQLLFEAGHNGKSGEQLQAEMLAIYAEQYKAA